MELPRGRDASTRPHREGQQPAWWSSPSHSHPIPASAQRGAPLEQGVITGVLRAPVFTWSPAVMGRSSPSDTARSTSLQPWLFPRSCWDSWGLQLVPFHPPLCTVAHAAPPDPTDPLSPWQTFRCLKAVTLPPRDGHSARVNTPGPAEGAARTPGRGRQPPFPWQVHRPVPDLETESGHWRPGGAELPSPVSRLG